MSLLDIQQSFFARTFQIESIREWLLGFGVLTAFILLFILYKAIRARRIRYSPYGSIVDAKTIRNVLRMAFDQRRPFEIQMQMEAGQRRPTLRCSPEQLGNDTLTVEVSGLKSLSDHWKGRPVTVFFRILLNRNFTYYTFSSSIAGIRQARAEICHITLPVPEVLENRQKRAFLRITPPREFFLGAAVWCNEATPAPEKMGEIALWPRPKVLLIPDRLEQFRILDISAGGARLCLPGPVARNLELQFNTTEQLFLMLDLFDPEQSKRLRFWMQCRIQNLWIEHTSRDVHMGLQFLAWGRPRGAAEETGQPGGIEWLRLSSSNEVEPVGNWIMRRHLELFRDQPLDS